MSTLAGILFFDMNGQISHTELMANYLNPVFGQETAPKVFFSILNQAYAYYIDKDVRKALDRRSKKQGSLSYRNGKAKITYRFGLCDSFCNITIL